MSRLRREAVLRRVTEWEMPVCLLLNRASHHRGIRRFFGLVSRMGNGVVWYSLAAGLLLLAPKAHLRALLQMALTGACCLSIYKLLKLRTTRLRPFEVNEEISLSVAPLDRYSFPSGHTMHAVCFTVVIASHYPHLAWVLAPFTTLVMLSRLVLGLHYPTDVLAGAGIGTAAALLALQL